MEQRLPELRLLARRLPGFWRAAILFPRVSRRRRQEKSARRCRRRIFLTYRPDKPPTKVPHTFQCTFCTETFRTKHNCQRHEKSSHLSFEHRGCSPRVSVLVNDHSEVVYMYCCLVGHNYAACQERQLEERTCTCT